MSYTGRTAAQQQFEAELAAELVRTNGEARWPEAVQLYAYDIVGGANLGAMMFVYKNPSAPAPVRRTMKYQRTARYFTQADLEDVAVELLRYLRRDVTKRGAPRVPWPYLHNYNPRHPLGPRFRYAAKDCFRDSKNLCLDHGLIRPSAEVGADALPRTPLPDPSCSPEEMEAHLTLHLVLDRLDAQEKLAYLEVFLHERPPGAVAAAHPAAFADAGAVRTVAARVREKVRSSLLEPC